MQNTRKLTCTASALALAALLSACGGGGSASPPQQVASANLTVPVTSATVAAFANIPFTFPGGLPELGLTGTSTLAFTDTSTTPAFRITTAGGTVTGVTTFGSCIFRITSAGSSLAALVGLSVRFTPCNVTLLTAGQPVGAASSASARFDLGLFTSLPAVITTVTISPAGAVTIGGSPQGNVTLAFVTGG